HSQCVTDVTTAVPVDVADLGVSEGRDAAHAQIDGILGYDECVTDVHHAVPVHVAAQERGGRGAGRGRRARGGGRRPRGRRRRARGGGRWPRGRGRRARGGGGRRPRGRRRAGRGRRRGGGERVARPVLERTDVAPPARGLRAGYAALIRRGRRTVGTTGVDCRAAHDEGLRLGGTAVACERGDRGVGVAEIAGARQATAGADVDIVSARREHRRIEGQVHASLARRVVLEDGVLEGRVPEIDEAPAPRRSDVVADGDVDERRVATVVLHSGAG